MGREQISETLDPPSTPLAGAQRLGRITPTMSLAASYYGKAKAKREPEWLLGNAYEYDFDRRIS